MVAPLVRATTGDALVNRALVARGDPPANHKRIYRLMKIHGLLLEKHTGKRPGRVHDGTVMVMRSNLRWCSDGLVPLVDASIACRSAVHLLERRSGPWCLRPGRS